METTNNNKVLIINKTYERLRTKYERLEKEYKKFFEENNIGKKELELLFAIENRRSKILFSEKFFPLEKEDVDKAHNNGYLEGLYKGASMQNEVTINRVLEKVFLTLNDEINVRTAFQILTQLLLSININTEFYLLSNREVKIAIVGEKEGYDFTEDYEILAYKNLKDKDFDYTYIDFDNIEYDYTPTDEDKDRIEKIYHNGLKAKNIEL